MMNTSSAHRCRGYWVVVLHTRHGDLVSADRTLKKTFLAAFRLAAKLDARTRGSAE